MEGGGGGCWGFLFGCLFLGFFSFFLYWGWRLWSNSSGKYICSPLRCSFSGLNGSSILSFWGSLRGSDENRMVALTQTRPPFLFCVGVFFVYFCRSEERKTCPVWEDPLLPSAFKTRCFFSWRKAEERTPSYLPVVIANFKISTTKEAVLEFVCHILKGSLRICSFGQGNLCEGTVKHTRHLKKITLIEQDGFKANPTNWASWLLRQILLLFTRKQQILLVAKGIFLI